LRHQGGCLLLVLEEQPRGDELLLEGSREGNMEVWDAMYKRKEAWERERRGRKGRGAGRYG